MVSASTFVMSLFALLVMCTFSLLRSQSGDMRTERLGKIHVYDVINLNKGTWTTIGEITQNLQPSYYAAAKFAGGSTVPPIACLAG